MGPCPVGDACSRPHYLSCARICVRAGDILKSADKSSGSRDQPRPTQRWFWQKMWSCTHAQATTSIKGSIVECVWGYKYLGTIIDSKLNFKSSFEAACKNGGQRLSCLRKRSHFHADKTTMVLFQHASPRSVLSFPLGVVVWIFICRKRETLPIKLLRDLNRLIGEPQQNIASLYTRWLQRLVCSGFSWQLASLWTVSFSFFLLEEDFGSLSAEKHGLKTAFSQPSWLSF